MGGCRCTYRNCQATTDGSTHFFHYPVFDMVRCHQWIANGRRYDLLDLKVSQLKNRVVCQRHFRDEMFMNFKKDKLTCSAVPTEDGPVPLKASTIQTDPKQVLRDAIVESPVKIDGISDDTKYYTPRERAATLSIPYKDFLENSDLDTLNDPDLLKSLQCPKRKPVPVVRRPPRFFKTRAAISRKVKTDNNKAELPPKPAQEKSNHNKEKVGGEKVTIIAEEKLSKPLPIRPNTKFMDISPSFVLQKPNKINKILNSKNVEQSKKLSNTTDNMFMPEQAGSANGVLQPTLPNIVSVTSVQDIDNSLVVHPPVVPIEYMPEKVDLLKNSSFGENVIPENVSRTVSSGSLKNSTFKVTPEKQAEIMKKRNFNIKLKNAVVQKLAGDQEEESVRVPKILNIHHQMQAHTMEQKVGGKVSPAVSSTLMSTVEENRRDIAEIKRILLGQGMSAAKSSALKVDKQTETDWSEESRKKYLYSQLSMYLSTSTKSAVYEELFLNTGPKRRRIK